MWALALGCAALLPNDGAIGAADVPAASPEALLASPFAMRDGAPVGVPIGGVGTGWLVIASDGVIRTAALSAEDPIDGPFGWIEIDLVDERGTRTYRLVHPGAELPPGPPTATTLRYRGLFPRCVWEGGFVDPIAAVDGGAEWSARVEAFSSFTPHDADRSSVPAIGFSIAVSAPAGALADGGEVRARLVIEEPLVDRISVVGDRRLSAGAPEDGRLALQGRLALGWHRDPKWHAGRFGSARAAAEHLLVEFDARAATIREWQSRLLLSSLPAWMPDRLLNDLSTLATGSHWTADGGFGETEAGRGLGRILGTLDQRLVAHVATQTFFPELDRAVLEIFADHQREDGEIQHHFGRVSAAIEDDPFREPNKGFTGWPDLAASFILQVQKHGAATGDRAFLDQMAPQVMKAARWIIAADRDQDGVPEGASTFDDAERGDGFSYHAGLAFAALEAAQAFTAPEARAELAAAATRAKRRLEVTLWNGRYFRHYVDPGAAAASDDSFLGQLAGSWFEEHLGRETGIDPARVDRALQSMAALHARPFPWIPPLEVRPDGRIGRLSYGWLPYTQTYLASLLIHRGQADDGLACAATLDRMRRDQDDPFRAVLYYDAATGRPTKGGYEWYMSTPASWFVLHALTGVWWDLAEHRIELFPSLPVSWMELRGPVFLPSADLDLLVEDTPGTPSRSIQWTVRAMHLPGEHRIDTLHVRTSPGISSVELDVDGQSRAATISETTRGFQLALEAPVWPRAGTVFEVRLIAEEAEIEASKHRQRVAERTRALENEALRCDFVIDDGGIRQVTLTEKAAGTSAVVGLPHPFKMEWSDASGNGAKGTFRVGSDRELSRGVRVVQTTHAVDRADGSAGVPDRYTWSSQLEVRSPGVNYAPLHASITAVLRDDPACLELSFDAKGEVLSGGYGQLRFPRLTVRDPGRIGEASHLLRRSAGAAERVEDPVHSLPWTGGGVAAERVEFVGPESTFALEVLPGEGAVRVHTAGTNSDALLIEVAQPFIAEGEHAQATRQVRIYWASGS